jgi:hypothetical protein
MLMCMAPNIQNIHGKKWNNIISNVSKTPLWTVIMEYIYIYILEIDISIRFFNAVINLIWCITSFLIQVSVNIFHIFGWFYILPNSLFLSYWRKKKCWLLNFSAIQSPSGSIFNYNYIIVQSNIKCCLFSNKATLFLFLLFFYFKIYSIPVKFCFPQTFLKICIFLVSTAREYAVFFCTAGILGKILFKISQN